MLAAHVLRSLPRYDPSCFITFSFSEKRKHRPTRPSRTKRTSGAHFSRGRQPSSVVQSRPELGHESKRVRFATAPRSAKRRPEPRSARCQPQPARAHNSLFQKRDSKGLIVAKSEHDQAAFCICEQSLTGRPRTLCGKQKRWDAGKAAAGRQHAHRRSSNGAAAGSRLHAANRLRSSGRARPARRPGGIQMTRAGPIACRDQTNQA